MEAAWYALELANSAVIAAHIRCRDESDDSNVEAFYVVIQNMQKCALTAYANAWHAASREERVWFLKPFVDFYS